MRLIAFILSSAIALASIPASASAASNTFRATSVSTTTCPVYEGYPDCHPDGAPCGGARPPVIFAAPWVGPPAVVTARRTTS
jgi:hypothetical protein